MKQRTYRRPANVGATVFSVGFGLLLAMPTVSTFGQGFGVDQLFGLTLVLMVFQVGWLAAWRPALVLKSDGVILRWSFGTVSIPYGKIRRLVLPPESPGLEIELDDGAQSRVSGFGSSMISRWLGNRQEKRISARFDEIRARADPSREGEVVKRLNWFAIIFPIVTVTAFFISFA
ncbi:PH domain-containing protein [Stackebrandtia albiflava]|nr:PH domain-containing protein [Stackebrandtia albiflava]